MAVHDAASEPSFSVRQSALELLPHLAGSSKRLDSPNEYRYQPTAAHISLIERPIHSADNGSTVKKRSKNRKTDDQNRSRVDQHKPKPEHKPEFTTKPTKLQEKKSAAGLEVRDKCESTEVVTGDSRNRVVNPSSGGIGVKAKTKKSVPKAAKRQRAAEAKRLEEKSLAVSARLRVKVNQDEQATEVKAGAQDEGTASEKNEEDKRREHRRLKRKGYRLRKEERERILAAQLSQEAKITAGDRTEEPVEKAEQQGDEREAQLVGGPQPSRAESRPPLVSADTSRNPDNTHYEANRTVIPGSSKVSHPAMPDTMSRDPTGKYKGNNFDPEYHLKRSAPPPPPPPARATALISPRTRYAYDAEQKRYYSKTPEAEHQRERYHPYARGYSPGVHGPMVGLIGYARSRGDINPFRGGYDGGREYDRRHDGYVGDTGRPTRFYDDRARQVPPRHDPHRYCSSSCDERPNSDSPRPSKNAHARTRNRLSAAPENPHHQVTHESSASSSPSSASSASASQQQITTPPLPEQQPQDRDGQALDSLAKLLQLQAQVQASGQNQRLDPIKIAEMAQSFLATQTRLEGSSPPDLSLTPEQAEERETPSRENELKEILLARQKEQQPEPQKSHEESFGTDQDVSEEGEITTSRARQVVPHPTERERTPVVDKDPQEKREESPASSRKTRAAEWAKRMRPVRHVDPTMESGGSQAAQPPAKPQQSRGFDADRRRYASEEKARSEIGVRRGPVHAHAVRHYDAKVDSAPDRLRRDIRPPQEQAFYDRLDRRETSPPQFRRRLYPRPLSPERRDEHDTRRSSRGSRDSQSECPSRSEGQALYDAFARSSSRRPSERTFDKSYPYVMDRERRDVRGESGGGYARRRSSGETPHDHGGHQDRGRRSSGDTDRDARHVTPSTNQRRNSGDGRPGASGDGARPPHQTQPFGVDVTVLETLAMLKAQIAKLEALVPAGLKSPPPRSEPTILSNYERMSKRGLTGPDSETRWPWANPRREEQDRSAAEHRPVSTDPPGGSESRDRPGELNRGAKRTSEPLKDKQDKRMRLKLEDRIQPRHSTSTPAASQAMRVVPNNNGRDVEQSMPPGGARDYTARNPPESKDSRSNGPRAQEKTYIGNHYRGYDPRDRGRGRGAGAGAARGRGWAPKRF